MKSVVDSSAHPHCLVKSVDALLTHFHKPAEQYCKYWEYIMSESSSCKEGFYG